MMLRPSSLLIDQSGSAAAELALSLPLLLILMFGSFEVGNYFLSEHVVQKAVRDAYAAHLRSFAQQTVCKPMPEGEWVGDSMLYLTSGEYPEPSINNDPIRNLNDRILLFAEAIRRGNDRSVGECLGKIFAGFCGTLNAAWIAEVSIFFSETLIGKTNTVRSHCHQIRLA